MANADLHSTFQAPFIPGFALFRRHIRRENFSTDAFFGKDVSQPLRHVAFLRVNRKHLDFSALG